MTETGVATPPAACEAGRVAVEVRAARGGRTGAFVSVAAFEFRLAARSRWILASAGGFVIAAIALSYFGLSAAGYSGFQGFERTAISLLSLSIYLAPLVGLVLGLGAFAWREGADLAFVLPDDRPLVIVGKLTGLTGALAAGTCLGLGAAGLIIAAEAGADGVAGYLALVAVTLALGAAFVGIGSLSALLVRDHLQASGLAMGSWIWLVFLYELVVLGVLCLVPESSVRVLLVATLFGSPVSLARVLALFALGAEPALGPAGALLLRWFGPGGTVALLGAGLLLWVAGPWAGAAWLGRRGD